MSRHPPGWYRDPGAPERARRWDGRAWTRDVRPLPPWLAPTVRLAPGPARRSRGRTARRRVDPQRLWMVSMTCAMLAMASLIIIRFPSTRPEPLVTDREWIRAAAAVCERGQHGVAAIEAGLPRRARLVALIQVVGPMVDNLGGLRVRDDDAAVVDRWLASWRRFVELGEDEAEALDDGDTVTADAYERSAVLPKSDIDRFALANGMTPCVFVG